MQKIVVSLSFDTASNAGIQYTAFYSKSGFMLIFNAQCLESRTFWIPACARMTRYRADGHHQRPVTITYPDRTHTYREPLYCLGSVTSISPSQGNPFSRPPVS